MEKKYSILDYIEQTQTILWNMVEDAQWKDCISWYLSKDIKSIYIVGSGTSCHSGLAVKKLLEDVLHLPVRAEFPHTFMAQSILSTSTLVIGISQGGSSVSTMNALRKAKEKGLPTMAIVGVSSAMLSQVADQEILIPCGEEKAAAKTKGYSATVLTLILFGLQTAYAQKKITNDEYQNLRKRLLKSIQNIDLLISYTNKWYQRNASELKKAKRILVIGYGNQYGTMLEASLKLLETVRISISGYECEEFMHGPYNSIQSDTYLFHICQKDAYQNRALHLKEYLTTITPHNFVLMAHTEQLGKDILFPFTDDEYFSVLEYIIPFQCISYQLSHDLGIDATIASDPDFHQKMGSKK